MNVALTWLIGAIFFAVVGAIVVPRRYRDKGLDDTNTTTAGVLGGFVSGPIIPAILWATTPKLKRLWMVTLTVSNLGVLYGMFATAYPTNLCVVAPYNATYLSQQVANGVVIGAIYALMAVGLTLIYSVAGIVSFTHGQLYMIGGYFSYYFLLLSSNYLTELRGEEVVVNPIFGILVAGVLVFIIGALFERMFLRPMHEGLIERAAEYAILITFGFGFFIEYATLAVAGPFPVRGERYVETRLWQLERVQITETAAFGPINIIADRGVAMVIGVVLIFALLYFLNRTWTGSALRATSMDKQAAAVTGINPINMNTLAFGIGAMLAGMSGAALVPIFSWVPYIGAEMAGRSYVIVVLGGLGSVPGALLGGIIVGVVEAVGSGCFPDPSRGAAYKEAFALLIFALVLLLKPTGLFGRDTL
ncbi:MAG: branched-chain amino acid ABC transporter permease [Chloroflexota bacterium]